jgi:hypothetical protein
LIENSTGDMLHHSESCHAPAWYWFDAERLVGILDRALSNAKERFVKGLKEAIDKHKSAATTTSS